MIIDAIHLYSIEYETETKIAELSLNRADLTQPYILQAAVGLDGGEFAPTFSGTSDNGAVRFYSMTQNDREIGLRLRLNPQSGSTYSSLRDAFYKAVSSSHLSRVQVRCMLGTTEKARISGFVKRLESSLFTNTPEISLSILCYSPYFVGASEQLVITNPSSPIFNDFNSTSPHGFRMQFSFTMVVDKLTLSNSPYWYFTLAGYSFAATDKLTIDSTYGEKTVYATRSSGIQVLLLDKIVAGSTWPILFPGTTQFKIKAERQTNGVYNTLVQTACSLTAASHTQTYWSI